MRCKKEQRKLAIEQGWSDDLSDEGKNRFMSAKSCSTHLY